MYIYQYLYHPISTSSLPTVYHLYRYFELQLQLHLRIYIYIYIYMYGCVTDTCREKAAILLAGAPDRPIRQTLYYHYRRSLPGCGVLGIAARIRQVAIAMLSYHTHTHTHTPDKHTDQSHRTMHERKNPTHLAEGSVLSRSCKT